MKINGMETVILFNIMNISMVLIRFRVYDLTAWWKKENVFLVCWKVCVPTLICSRHFASLAPDNAPVLVLLFFSFFVWIQWFISRVWRSLQFMHILCRTERLVILNAYSLREFYHQRQKVQTRRLWTMSDDWSIHGRDFIFNC